jgi:hypothetical protein
LEDSNPRTEEKARRESKKTEESTKKGLKSDKTEDELYSS